MQSEKAARVTIEYSTEFVHNLRELAKRYRHIKSDVQPVIAQLQGGQTLGDQVPGTAYTIYKVRVRNSDSQRGKRGGYRLLYYLRTTTKILLVTIYSKSDQSDISTQKIRKIVEAWKA